MKSKLKRSSSEKKAYYIGMGYAMACDLKMPSVDVKKYGGEKAYRSFVAGRGRAHNQWKYPLSKILHNRKKK